jgi:hypothetical protein
MTETTVRQRHFESMAIAVGSIWVAVATISLGAPDMVSGSEQQHLPIAAFGTWLWGTIATISVLHFWTGRRHRSARADRLELHRVFAVGVAAVWAVATGVALFGPVMVTGTDPTRMPLAAIIAPIAATVITILARAAVGIVADGLLSDVDQSRAQDQDQGYVQDRGYVQDHAHGREPMPC